MLYYTDQLKIKSGINIVITKHGKRFCKKSIKNRNLRWRK